MTVNATSSPVAAALEEIVGDWLKQALGLPEHASWMGGTTWGGRRLMRISVSNWSTTEADVDRSVASIRRVLELERSAA